MAAWCPMELLIEVTPDILLWLGLGEGRQDGKSQVQNKVESQLDHTLPEEPWPEAFNPLLLQLTHLKMGAVEDVPSTQGTQHSAQHSQCSTNFTGCYGAGLSRGE